MTNTVPPEVARLTAIQVRYRSVCPVRLAKAMIRLTRTLSRIAPTRPTHTFPVIPAKITPPRAAANIIPSRAMFIIPAFLLITAASPAKISGVDSLSTENPKLANHSIVNISISPFRLILLRSLLLLSSYHQRGIPLPLCRSCSS